jgi:hypothetical protein
VAVPFIIKGTIVFSQIRHGWTESFFWQSNDGDLHNHSASLLTVCTKRRRMLGQQGVIQAYRVSVETDADGKPRLGDSMLAYTSLGADTQEDSDEQDAALMVTQRNLVAQRRRNMFLRGIWDSIDLQAGRFDGGNANFTSRYNDWVAAMLAIGGGAGWIALDANPKVNVSTYDQNANGTVTITLAGAVFGAGPYVKQKVRFAGINGKSPLNGNVIVLPTSATECVTVKPYAVLPYDHGGTITTYGTHFERAVDYSPQKITTRRVGAPLLESRGRARATVRA